VVQCGLCGFTEKVQWPKLTFGQIKDGRRRPNISFLTLQVVKCPKFALDFQPPFPLSNMDFETEICNIVGTIINYVLPKFGVFRSWRTVVAIASVFI